jgi:hypothetical protein
MSIAVMIRPGLIQAFFAVPPALYRALLPNAYVAERLLCLFPVT